MTDTPEQQVDVEASGGGGGLQLYGPPGSLTETEAGTVALAAQEESEVKAAVVMARNFPRDEQSAYLRMLSSAQRPTFAVGALYSFPRGGKTIMGPSVKMARDMARCWGNMQHGIRVVSMDADWVHVKGWAWDLQTNTRVESEAKFKRLIQRKRGGNTVWEEPDERDLRELVNKHGAVAVRNSILNLMPPDVVDEIQATCLNTNRRKAEGEIGEDREAVLRALVAFFSTLGVTPPMLEGYLGHPMELITPAELTDLRAVGTAMRDGNAQRSDYFDVPGGGTQSPASTRLEEKLREAHAGDTDGVDTSTGEILTTEASVAPPAETETLPDTGPVPPPTTKDLVAKARAARQRATEEKEEVEGGDPEVRVADKQWVGTYPAVKEALPRVLGKITNPEIVVNMALADERVTAKPAYVDRLVAFSDLPAVLKLLPRGDEGDDLMIEMLALDARDWAEAMYVAALKERGIDVTDDEDA